MKAELNISVVLRRDFEQFVSQHIEEFKHVYMNFSEILFVKDEDLDKPVEIFKVEGHLRLVLPTFKYIIVASESYNVLGTDKNRNLYHILKHIPKKFTGEIVPHENERFDGEDKFL